MQSQTEWTLPLRAHSSSCGCFGEEPTLTSHPGSSYRQHFRGSLEMKGLNNPCLWKKNLGAKNQEKLFSITCSIYIFLTLALTAQLLGFIPTRQGSLVPPTSSKKAALWPGALLISLIWEMIFYIISYLCPAPAENLFCFATWNLIFVDSLIFF